jgi:elastase-2
MLNLIICKLCSKKNQGFKMKFKLSILLLSISSTFTYAGQQHLINSLDKEFSDEEYSNSFTPRVINGTDASISDFPFYSELIATNTDVKNSPENLSTFAHYCGSSILDQNHILTAAHCVEDLTSDTIKKQGVMINTDDHASALASNVYPMEDVYIYGDYNAALVSHDIAVIKLSKSLPNSVTSVSIPTDAERNDYNNTTNHPEFTIVGFGYIDDNSTKPTKLQRAQLLNIGDSNCETDVLNTYGITFVPNLQTCVLPKNLAVDTNTGSCNGDSGGPLSYFDNTAGEYKQVALTSFGHIDSCSKIDAPQVFTEIKGYSNWIEAIVAESPYNYIKISRNNSIVDNNEDSGGDSGGSIPLFGLVSLGLFSLFRRKNKR